jgi:subtilisin family serine protease
MYPHGAVPDLQIHVVTPVERVAIGLAAGGAHHVIGASFVGMGAGFRDRPHAAIRLAVAVSKAFVQNELVAVPCAGNIHGELPA